MIALEQVEDCPHCAANSGVTSTQCYGCWVRYTARLPRHGRESVYSQVHVQHGADVLETFKQDVTSYYKMRKETSAYV